MKVTSIKKLLSAALIPVLALSLAACGGKGSSSGDASKKDNANLTFQIWDINQKAGMESLAKAYHEKNPNVNIEVQVTSWDEYWTKLEASASSNKLPDIFWMHTNEIFKYADNGILADVTNLYDEESKTYYKDHFSDISIKNTMGSNGKMYGVPKDKDTICLIYNKDMFDKAGVAYPDENWTWDNLVDASKKIHEKTGKYGFMPLAEDHMGYWSFVYQAGGSILNEDKTKGNYLDPATKKGIEFYVNLQKNDWSPKQKYFAETTTSAAFFSEQGAMYFEGTWNLKPNMEANTNMVGKWDVAVLPKCPNPAKGDGRATISNGICYATAAKGKNLEAVKGFLKFLGSEEGQKIQGESGTAIPAYKGLESTWAKSFEKYSYKINVQKCLDMFEYGVQSINNASRPTWKPKTNDILLKMYSGEYTIDQGLQEMQNAVDKASSK